MLNKYFNHIALINLKKREDRLHDATQTLNSLGIDFELWEATENEEHPCRGLVDSMQRYFRKVLSEGGDRCLIFEDDIKLLIEPEEAKEALVNCMKELPQDWDLFYLGCNPASGFTEFHSPSILPIRIAYATHATAYSKRAMELVVSRTINEPIDNFLVREFQPMAKCYVSYPMIFTQNPNYSDIGKAYTDWSNFLEVRYNAEIRKIMKI